MSSEKCFSIGRCTPRPPPADGTRFPQCAGTLPRAEYRPPTGIRIASTSIQRAALRPPTADFGLAVKQLSALDDSQAPAD